jgi:hypothetical protein
MKKLSSGVLRRGHQRSAQLSEICPPRSNLIRSVVLGSRTDEEAAEWAWDQRSPALSLKASMFCDQYRSESSG